jgi:hypothetical protein
MEHIEIDQVLAPVYEVRRENLKAIAALTPGGSAGLAKKLGQTSAYLSQLIGENAQARTISEKVARKAERKLGLVYGWLDMKRAA